MSAETKVFQDKMSHSIEHLSKELSSVRAGRANPAVLDKVTVDYYGAPTPINQVAAVSVAEARVLTISPWDATLMKAIEKAILSSDIGITPTNDGRVMRLVFPAPTEERRKQLVKEVLHMGEEAKIAVRNVRRDAMNSLKREEKDGDITEDEQRNLEKQVQKVTDDAAKKIDQLADEKRKEITQG